MSFPFQGAGLPVSISRLTPVRTTKVPNPTQGGLGPASQIIVQVVDQPTEPQGYRDATQPQSTRELAPIAGTQPQQLNAERRTNPRLSSDDVVIFGGQC